MKQSNKKKDFRKCSLCQIFFAIIYEKMSKCNFLSFSSSPSMNITHTTFSFFDIHDIPASSISVTLCPIHKRNLTVRNTMYSTSILWNIPLTLDKILTAQCSFIWVPSNLISIIAISYVSIININKCMVIIRSVITHEMK